MPLIFCGLSSFIQWDNKEQKVPLGFQVVTLNVKNDGSSPVLTYGLNSYLGPLALDSCHV